MRFLTRSFVALFLGAVALALLAWAGQITRDALEARSERSPGRPPARERVFPVDVMTITPQTITPVLAAFGEVQATRTLELRAPVGGRIIELSDGFVEGGTIAGGDVLLRIDAAQAEASLALARADLAGAEAEVRDADRALDLARRELASAEAQRDLQAVSLQRQKDLVARGVGAAATLEAAELALRSAEQTILTRQGAIAAAEARVDSAALGVERAGIALANAERDLSDHVVLAEFDGVLSDVSALAGGLVTPNERLGALIDPSALEVAFRLSTAQHARLSAGGGLIDAPVVAALDVFGLTVEAQGRIIREAPAVGEGRTGRLVFASLEQAPGFRPGDFVRVSVEEPSLDRVAALPSAALSPQGSVLVIGEDERLEEVAVETLRQMGDTTLIATRGLNGREVVAARGPALGAGIKVDPRREGGTAEEQTEELVTLDPERRARLIAFVEGGRMPDAVKQRLLARLQQDQVPARVVARIESRMGG